MQRLQKHKQQHHRQHQEIKEDNEEEQRHQQSAKRHHQIDSGKIIKPIVKASVLFCLDNLFLY